MDFLCLTAGPRFDEVCCGGPETRDESLNGTWHGQMRIGLDFDNTLVSYDRAFLEVGREERMLPGDFAGAKEAVHKGNGTMQLIVDDRDNSK